MWSYERIVTDLRKLKAKGAEPDIFALKNKYGYESNSEFFPLIDEIGDREKGLKTFVASIFSGVSNPLDLNFRNGPCHCSSCREDDDWD